MIPSHRPFAPRFVATLVMLAAATSASREARAQVAPLPEPPPPTQTFATPPGQGDAGDLKAAGPLLLPPPPPPAPPAVVAQPEPPYEPPPPRPVPEYDDPSWSFEGAAFTPGPRVSLSVLRLMPEKYGNATGGLIGIDVVGITDDDDSDDVLGFAGDMGLSIGVNSDGNIPFDAHFGMGFGLILGPLRIAPLAGVGADTLGGGDGGFSMNGAFYWLVEGRARLGFEGLGIEGFGGRAFRGNISGDRAFDVPRETRAAIQAFTVLDDDDELFFGASFTDFGEARAFGAFVGYGANRE